MDKNELFQYVYLTKIILDYHENNLNMNFKESLITSFKNMKKYHKFMIQACKMENQKLFERFYFQSL